MDTSYEEEHIEGKDPNLADDPNDSINFNDGQASMAQLDDEWQ